MGFFWDLMQQNQISQQRDRASTLDQRVSQLEDRLDDTNKLLRLLLERLEKQLGEDIDKDGRVG
jgi:BMFP domain-containing protein YqiC